MTRPVLGQHQQRDEDRRSSRRFQISLPVRYRLLVKGAATSFASAHTINISASGIAIATEEDLPKGTSAELQLDWPVLLNESCALRLWIRGLVVRTEAHRAVLKIQAYEFRTCKFAGTGPLLEEQSAYAHQAGEVSPLG